MSFESKGASGIVEAPQGSRDETADSLAAAAFRKDDSNKGRTGVSPDTESARANVSSLVGLSDPGNGSAHPEFSARTNVLSFTGFADRAKVSAFTEFSAQPIDIQLLQKNNSNPATLWRVSENVAEQDVSKNGTRATKSDAVKQAKQPKDAPACPPSPDYQKVINTAARNMFDPQRLGDLSKVLNQYNCEIKSPKDALDKANIVLMNTGDRFNHMIFPSGVQSFDDFNKGIYYGVGISYDKEVGQPLKVTEVKKGGPAEVGHITAGDTIFKIDNKETAGMNVNEITTALRGANGSNVNLEFEHEGIKNVVEVKRAEFKMPPEVTDPIDKGDGITYIRVKSFSRFALADEMQASMGKQPNARAYVIDLRGNGGGLVDSAADLTSLFMDEGTVYNMKRRKDSDPATPQYYDQLQRVTKNGVEIADDNEVATRKRHPNLAADKPIVILTDGATASSAEIFTAAMRENGRAIVIGEKTFGKGIGQTWYTMPGDSLLYVTSSHIMSPKNNWVGDAHNIRNGLDPDIKIVLNKGALWTTPEDNQLEGAVNYLRQKLGVHQATVTP